MKKTQKKKIGLTTCFLDNYGACLQACALQNSIKQLGYDCEILPFVGIGGYSNINQKSIFKSRLKNFLRSLKYFYKKQKPQKTTKRTLAFYRFRKKYLNFETEGKSKKIRFYYSIEDFNDVSEKYDAFVCGSDQIWNPTFYQKNNPVYFLRFAKDKKRIAYAPSIGLPDIPFKYRDEFIAYINDFHYLSVREQRGAEIIQELCNLNAQVVLDPTLLIGKEFWNTILKDNYKIPLKKYILCYIFSNTEKCSSYLKQIQTLTGLPIIYFPVSNLCYDQLNAKCMHYAGPLDFLHLIKHAEYVITDSFHGTAFSLLFNKEFYIFKRERTDEAIDMYSRIESILTNVGLEDRAFSLDNPFTIKEDIDYLTVNSKLEIIRKNSFEYLQNALLGV